MIVKPRFGLKAPIEGVSFSNEEVSLELEFETQDGDWEAVEEQLSKQVKAVTKKYFQKLAEEIDDGQSKVIEELQVKFEEEYGEKLRKAKEEIVKLKRENQNG